jgi:hypothetical protein
MPATDLFELSGSTTSRRTVLRAALGGLVTLGISACGREGSADSGATDTRSTGTTDLAGRALAGVPVEVWRDPG